MSRPRQLIYGFSRVKPQLSADGFYAVNSGDLAHDIGEMLRVRQGVESFYIPTEQEQAILEAAQLVAKSFSKLKPPEGLVTA